jgi:hypothetical protein
MASTTSLIPFERPASATDVAQDHSLLEIDRELDMLLEQIEDEIEEQGEASKEAMERFEVFCKAMNVKVDLPGQRSLICLTFCKSKGPIQADGFSVLALSFHV